MSQLRSQDPMASTRTPRPEHRHMSPPPSNQRARRGYRDPHSLSYSSQSQNSTSSPALEGSSPSRPSSPLLGPLRGQDADNLRLRRKISALEDTVNRLESAGGSSKRRYEYVISKGTKLTFDLILPVGHILRISPDMESVRS
jgi:hypothetical protein